MIRQNNALRFIVVTEKTRKPTYRFVCNLMLAFFSSGVNIKGVKVTHSDCMHLLQVIILLKYKETNKIIPAVYIILVLPLKAHVSRFKINNICTESN